jgi:RNA polymerase sigma factor (sigma-70 family)
MRQGGSPACRLGNRCTMSKTTAALETAVAIVLENTPAADVRATPRQRVTADRAFAQILKLIAPRIRHFIRQYGLAAHWDDAEQACAIGVHRAIQAYEPEKAQFTTFVNWQLRGELQSLRFRLMTDQRPSAKKVEATTVSLHAMTAGADGEEASLEATIEDGDALARTEAGASDFLADGAKAALIDRYVAHLREVGTEQLKRRARTRRSVVQVVDPDLPRFRARAQAIDAAELKELEDRIAQARTVVERRLFDDATLEDVGTETGIAKERVRQITKSAARIMADLAAAEPRFAIMASANRPAARPVGPRKAVAAGILPDGGSAHNQFARVVAIDPLAPPVEPATDTEVEAAPAAPMGFAAREKVVAD